jgi:type II secretory pathway pseudopilin PulG
MSISSRTAAIVNDQSGVTLVELAVTTIVMGLICSVFLSVLASVQMSMAREDGRSQTMDQGRLAIEALDRDIRSASKLCSVPSSPANFGLSAFIPYPSQSAHWIQYRVSSQTLQRRESLTTTPDITWPSTWRTVATGIVNPSTTAPFVIDSSALVDSRIVNVTLLVNTAASDASSSNVRLASSIAIRNQSSSVVCPTG